MAREHHHARNHKAVRLARYLVHIHFQNKVETARGLSGIEYVCIHIDTSLAISHAYHLRENGYPSVAIIRANILRIPCHIVVLMSAHILEHRRVGQFGNALLPRPAASYFVGPIDAAVKLVIDSLYYLAARSRVGNRVVHNTSQLVL